MSDYISRTDAIEALSRSSVYAWSTEQDLVAHSWAIRILQSLPSADAVSRKAKCCPIAETCMSIDCPVSSEYIGRPSADAVQGEWVIEDAHTEHCSVCGYAFYTSALFAVGGNDEPNYCPNCGARMKGGAE